MGHAPVDVDPHVGDIGKLQRVVWLGENRLGEILPNLVLVDVEGGDHVDVLDAVVPDLGVHEAGNLLVLRHLDVFVQALHERRGAVSDPNNGDFDFSH